MKTNGSREELTDRELSDHELDSTVGGMVDLSAARQLKMVGTTTRDAFRGICNLTAKAYNGVRNLVRKHL